MLEKKNNFLKSYDIKIKIIYNVEKYHHSLGRKLQVYQLLFNAKNNNITKYSSIILIKFVIICI